MQPISIEECLRGFDQHIEDAHKQIAEEIHQISDTDGYVQEKMASFQNEINSLQFEGKNQFEKELASILGTYKRDCAIWCDSVNAFIKGKEFINQFEKSVLVVVFGNVNVGKSSVGNLIAGVTDPDSCKGDYEKDKKMLGHYFGEPPVFYEYDLAGSNAAAKAERKRDSFFKEGHQETTAQIQYFTRNGGLTWTDSPGICSVNKDNGDLAKKYVEFADLVVFITTSSSPAKYDEVQELKKLFVKKKPLLILVNKSDMTVKDEVDGKIVKYLAPKTPQDRQKQEGYIRDLFRDGAMDVISQVDSVSIITWLALQSMRTGDSEMFAQSGFPRFYAELGKILEKDAVKLKMNAPRQRVNSMIDEIICGGNLGAHKIEGIKQYRDRLEVLKGALQKAKAEMDKLPERAVPIVENKCMDKITPLVQDAAYNARKHAGSTELGQEINQVVTETVSSVLEQELHEILKDYNSSMVGMTAYNAAGNLQVNAKIETIEREVYDIKTISRDPSGLIEHFEHWVFKKEFTQDVIKTRKVRETFVNGDNSPETLKKIQDTLGATAHSYVCAFVENVKVQYFSKVESLAEEILGRLLALENDLERGKMKDA